MPFPSQRDLSNPGIKPASPALQAESLLLSYWETKYTILMLKTKCRIKGNQWSEEIQVLTIVIILFYPVKESVRLDFSRAMQGIFSPFKVKFFGIQFFKWRNCMLTSLNQPDLEKSDMKINILFEFLKLIPSKTKSRRAEVCNTSNVPSFHKGMTLQKTEGWNLITQKCFKIISVRERTSYFYRK